MRSDVICATAHSQYSLVDLWMRSDTICATAHAISS